jgi:hypothetical protein
MNTGIRASAATAAAAALMLSPSVAHAGGGEDIEEGACFGAVTWKFKAAEQEGRVALEYEVDANRRGQQWRVALFHNGSRIVFGTYTTRGLSGSFSVNDLEPDRGGEDRFRARAVRLSDGRTCGGSVLF